MANVLLVLVAAALTVGDGSKTTPVVPLAKSRFDCFSMPFSMCIGNPATMQVSKVLAPEARHKDMTGWWKFDDGFGYDWSGNGAHAQPVPAAGPARGGHGASAAFNGKEDFIMIPNSKVAQSRQMTVMFWMYLLEDFTGTMRTILRKGASADEKTPTIMLQAESRRLRVLASSEAADKEGFDSVAYIPPKRWTHVALMIEGKLMQLYVNGMFDSQVVMKGNAVFNTGPFVVGKDMEGAGTKMYLDDLRLYGSSLDETQLQAITGGSGNALGSMGPTQVRLGCKGKPCKLEEALNSCPRTFHLCTVKELYAGALGVARAQGWFQMSPNVWPRSARVSPRNKDLKRLAVCCHDGRELE